MFAMANERRGFASMGDGSRDGHALMVDVSSPGAGWPWKRPHAIERFRSARSASIAAGISVTVARNGI